MWCPSGGLEWKDCLRLEGLSQADDARHALQHQDEELRASKGLVTMLRMSAFRPLLSRAVSSQSENLDHRELRDLQTQPAHSKNAQQSQKSQKTPTLHRCTDGSASCSFGACVNENNCKLPQCAFRPSLLQPGLPRTPELHTLERIGVDTRHRIFQNRDRKKNLMVMGLAQSE